MKRYSGLLVVLALLGALVVSQVAAAASPARPAATVAHPTLRDDGDEAFEGEEELEFEDCESGDEFEFEFEEAEEEDFGEEELEADCGEEEEVKAAPKGARSVTAPAACKVRAAESTITALPGSDELRLSVHYRTSSPTQVTVGVRLKDRKGSVPVTHVTRHVGPQGVLDVDTKLSAALMQRALTASEFDVSLRAPETPAFCAGALEQRLHTAAARASRAR